MKHFFIILLASIAIGCTQQKNPCTCSTTAPKVKNKQVTPIMGWASWNNYRVNINEEIILSQVDAMAENGMRDAGYSYINVDDGYFGGRDENGNLLVHPERFPNGMKAVADYIHSKGFNAGIYSDAGINTCASYWDKDTIGVGMGLYGHDKQDLTLFLNDWGYDFIKIDWCGGEWLGLDEQTRYTQIANTIKEVKPETVYNICRWTFPGKWATLIADSWRISGDIDNTFGSIMHIVDLNADLWRWAGPGHVNDMDMLQVGRGMSYEEDKTHFTMWCMMCSPLLAGNDLTSIKEETMSILTNNEVIALNQDPLVYQARRLVDEGDFEVWAKPLTSVTNGKVAVTLLNRSNKTTSISFDLETIGLDAKAGYTMRDLWEKKDFATSQNVQQEFEVAAHGVVTLIVQGKSIPYNVFQQ